MMSVQFFTLEVPFKKMTPLGSEKTKITLSSRRQNHVKSCFQPSSETCKTVLLSWQKVQQSTCRFVRRKRTVKNPVIL